MAHSVDLPVPEPLETLITIANSPSLALDVEHRSLNVTEMNHVYVTL